MTEVGAEIGLILADAGGERLQLIAELRQFGIRGGRGVGAVVSGSAGVPLADAAGGVAPSAAMGLAAAVPLVAGAGDGAANGTAADC